MKVKHHITWHELQMKMRLSVAKSLIEKRLIKLIYKLKLNLLVWPYERVHSVRTYEFE